MAGVPDRPLPYAWIVPELPEVETVRRTLAPRIVGRYVLAARLLRRDVLIAPGDPRGGFARQRQKARHGAAEYTPVDLLQGCRIVDILRRGKQLAVIGRAPDRSERALIVQLGMSGQVFVVEAAGEHPSTHVHAMWDMGARGKDSGAVACHMVFRDPRRFGGLRVLRSRADLDAHWSELGPDALEITEQDLLSVCRGSIRAVKAVLLDQSAVAGVGNIYADEALFRAGIKPSRPARRVKSGKAVALAEAIRAVLEESIEARGSTLRDYRDADGREGGFKSRHAVYGRGGRPCLRCGRKLRSAVMAQRTTVWCPSCQK